MDRRRLLASVGTALATGLGGCVEPGAGRYSSDSEPRFDRWLPTPGTIGTEQYDFRYADVPAVVDRREAFADGVLDGYDRRLGVGGPVRRQAGVALEDLGFAVASKRFAVLHADHDRDALGDALESRDYSLADEYDDEALLVYRYDGAAGSVAVGLAEGVVIGVGNLGIADGDVVQTGTAPDSPEEAVRTILEASEGDAARYASVDPHVETLARRMGDGTAGWGFSGERVAETAIDRGEFAGEVARGLEFDVDGGTTDFADVIVFDRGEPPVDAVTEWLETERPFRFATGDPDYSVDVDGHVVVVSGSFDTDEALALP